MVQFYVRVAIFVFYFQSRYHYCRSLFCFLFGSFSRGSPARQLNLTGRFGVPHHELNILQVPRRGEPDGVRQEDEEDSGGDDQEKGDSQVAVRVELLIN